MSKTVIIRDVTFNYAFVYKTHAPFGVDQWDIQVTTTDKTKADELKSVGVNMKDKDGVFVGNVKRKLANAKGEKNNPPIVIDKNKNDLTDPIGNGSKGNLKLFCYDIKAGPMKGKPGAMLSAIQVTELIPYEGSSNDEDF